MNRKLIAGLAGLAAITAGTTAAAWPTNKPVYILSANKNVTIDPLATTGDKFGSFVLRGIPDGMGAYKNELGQVVLISNHEVATNDKLAAKSASTTAQWGVSLTKFKYSTKTGQFTGAENFITSINYYNYKTGLYQSTPVDGAPADAAKDTFGWGISRFCSATFSPAGTFSYKSGSETIGYTGALFTTGEEIGDNSRGFAFDMDGVGYQLPRVGMLSFETISPTRKVGPNTVAIANEDGSATDSQLHVYIGKKTNTGSPVDKAGLTNGDLYVLNAGTIATDNVFRTTIAKSTPVDVNFKKIEWNTGVTAFAKGARDNGMTFARIEDGEWDPNNPDVYYFITTESNKDPLATKENPAEPGVSRDGGGLWRLTFKDAQNPLLGAKLELLLNGTEAPYLSKPDNLAVTKSGVITIQEDPGNNAHVARVIAYQISTGKLATIAEFDKQYFTPTGSNYMTIDEESSGIWDATSLLAAEGDKNTYLFFNAQVHTYSGVSTVDPSVKGALQPARPDFAKRTAVNKAAIDKATVEGGQYYRMTVSDWSAVFNG